MGGKDKGSGAWEGEYGDKREKCERETLEKEGGEIEKEQGDGNGRSGDIIFIN